MIYFDVTKSGSARHRSGLMRVSARLREELGDAAQPISWKGGFREFSRPNKIDFQAADWLLTAELFSEQERPGFWEFLKNPPCRLAAIFHDAIPLKLPHVTWPQSVARLPEYMKMLAAFDRVFAVSEASRRDLVEFWRWQGVMPRPRVDTISLGADFDGGPRATESAGAAGLAKILCVGIIEPRKNQSLVLEAAKELRREGLGFELHFVGRVNPHFGRPIAANIKAERRSFPGLYFHGPMNDRSLARLYEQAAVSVFPTQAEGCGLPLLESLWRGVPCVCSDLPVLRESSAGGGCLPVPANDTEAWKAALRAILTDAGLAQKLRAEAISRLLPRWADTATALRSALAG